MPFTLRCVKRTALALGFALAMGGANASATIPDDATLNQVVDLNKKALVAYENLEMEAAAKQLKQALELCAEDLLDQHPAAARTRIHLGVVYVSGLKDKEKGIAEFQRALDIDPNIRVTKSLLNPEVQAAFDEALATRKKAAGSDPALPFPTGPTSGRRTGRPTSTGPTVPGLNHPPITEGTAGNAVDIKVQIPPGMRAATIVLAYRARGEGDFLAREMRPLENANGWYHEKIPAEATQGDQVSYYIEARDGDGVALASSGTPQAPYTVQLRSQVRPDEDEGLAKNEDAQPVVPEAPLWLLFAVGGGGGYYSGEPEMNPRQGATSLKTSGIGLARLAHLAPEIGYFHTDHLRFSLQGRIQYVTGSQDVVKDRKTYKTTKSALAMVAKATYVLTAPGSPFRPFLSAQVGFGDIRYPVTTVPLPGCGADNTTAPCKDTVRGGVGLAGAAAGFTYMVSESVGLYTALSGLVGFPRFILNADVNVGIAFVQ